MRRLVIKYRTWTWTRAWIAVVFLPVALGLGGCLGQSPAPPVSSPAVSSAPPVGSPAVSPIPAAAGGFPADAGPAPTIAGRAVSPAPDNPAPRPSFTPSRPAAPSVVAAQAATATATATVPAKLSATPTAAARAPSATASPRPIGTRRQLLPPIPNLRDFPIAKESKLGVGVYATGGHIMDALRRAEPGVILLQEPKVEFALEVRRNFPRAFIVGKRFQINGQPLDNPAARGAAFADYVAELAVPLKGAVDAWQSYNEPIGGGNLELYAAYDQFQTAFAQRLQGQYGVSAVAGNDPAGAMQPEDYPNYFASSIQASDYFGVHAYSSGERPFRLKEPSAEWYILRYRKIHDALEAAGISGVRMIMTESGHAQGWRNKLDFEPVVDDFYWLTAELEKDPYMIGHAIFGLFGDGNWPEFDLPIGILDYLRGYAGYPAVPPDPTPVSAGESPPFADNAAIEAVRSVGSPGIRVAPAG